MKRYILSCIVMILTICVICSCGSEKAVPVSVEPVQTDETISIFAVGDNLMHMPVVNSGKQPDGTYDYAPIFSALAPDIRSADIAVIGQETVFGGADKGYSGYPAFNSPSDVGKSLVNQGFDVILHASNHILDRGASGVERTIEFWKGYPDTMVLGISENEQEYADVEIMDIKGARIAMLNYTYGTNGYVLPSDKPYLVNYIDEEKIMSDCLFAEQNADFTIAFMHWGVEYATKPSAEQKELAAKMCSWGTDLIIGSHPHVIEPAEWIYDEAGNSTFVYYSLGNFVSRQLEAKNLLGGAAKVNLHYDGETVSISDCSFEPIVTHYNKTYREFCVYPLEEYTPELEAAHGLNSVSISGWEKLLHKVFEEYDTSLIDYPLPISEQE